MRSNTGPLERQLLLFIELSILVAKKCSTSKNTFKDGNHNKLIKHSSDEVFGVIYYNNNYKTWTVRVNKVEYKNYKKSIEINLDNLSSQSVAKAVNLLRDYYDNFDNNFKEKRKTFNFNK